MKRINYDELHLNPFTLFDDYYGIVGVGKKEDANIMTISWGQMGILWHKKVVTLYIRESRYTKELLEKYDTVTVSFLDHEKYKKELALCGSITGRGIDKFKACNLNSVSDIDTPYTYVKEAFLVLKAKKIYETKIDLNNIQDKTIIEKFGLAKDNHFVYVCEIKQFCVDEKYFDEVIKNQE